MESIIQKRRFLKGDLVRFVTVISGTAMDDVSGALGVVTDVKGSKVSLYIMERHLSNIPAGCLQHVEK